MKTILLTILLCLSAAAGKTNAPIETPCVVTQMVTETIPVYITNTVIESVANELPACWTADKIFDFIGMIILIIIGWSSWLTSRSAAKTAQDSHDLNESHCKFMNTMNIIILYNQTKEYVYNTLNSRPPKRQSIPARVLDFFNTLAIQYYEQKLENNLVKNVIGDFYKKLYPEIIDKKKTIKKEQIKKLYHELTGEDPDELEKRFSVYHSLELFLTRMNKHITNSQCKDFLSDTEDIESIFKGPLLEYLEEKRQLANDKINDPEFKYTPTARNPNDLKKMFAEYPGFKTLKNGLEYSLNKL